MSDNTDNQNTDNNETTNNQNQNTDNSTNTTNTSNTIDMNNPDIKKLVQDQIDAEFKSLKDKLDSAYASRDEAMTKLAEFEQKEKEAERKRLEEEGKHKELYERDLAEERSKRVALEKRNVELTRDISVRDELRGYDFRNSSASEMAFREIVTELTQDDNGNWVHKSGKAVTDFVKEFMDNENNSFLLKVKANSGGGSGESNNTDTSSSKSLFDMSQDEVLAKARAGTLRKS
jgi:hypothetical protein